MFRRFAHALAAALAALALLASPAFAGLSDEVQAGASVAAELRAGDTSCAQLSDAQLEHLGEYEMDRMAGSRELHTAINARMEQALGGDRTERMHEFLGRRVAGCGVGPAMMGGARAGLPDRDWAWMHDGAWQHMSSGDWRDLAGSMMGVRSSSSHGWLTTGVAVAGGVLLGALLAVVLIRRRPPA